MITPRLGFTVIEGWLSQALNLVAPPASSTHRQSDAFIVRLLARIWCHAVEAASRHGPPGLRVPVSQTGRFVRGRLDVAATVRSRQRGAPNVSSVYSVKTLDHAISRTIVCGERALRQALPGRPEWRTDRVRELLPRLCEAVGSRPRLPRPHELSRIRYTPITLPYRRAVDISWRISSKRGFSASSDPGQAHGLLIDVAELWELFVVNCARRAFTGSQVDHGSPPGRQLHLLRALDGASTIGRLIPDVHVHAGGNVPLIMDAKYKRLSPTRERPTGVDRGDLYQIAAYMHRLRAEQQTVGALVYPEDGSSLPSAVTDGPWQTEAGNSVHFLRVPTSPEECVKALRDLAVGTINEPRDR